MSKSQERKLILQMIRQTHDLRKFQQSFNYSHIKTDKLSKKVRLNHCFGNSPMLKVEYVRDSKCKDIYIDCISNFQTNISKKYKENQQEVVDFIIVKNTRMKQKP